MRWLDSSVIDYLEVTCPLLLGGQVSPLLAKLFTDLTWMGQDGSVL